MRIKTHEDKVLEILRDSTKPLAKEDDSALYFYLLKELKFDMDRISARQLLEGIYTKAYPNWESVGRLRRKIQEQHPETRGKNYEKRHAEQESVKTELGYHNTPDNAPGTTP